MASRKARPIGPAAVDPLPRISVIIPIKNEPIDAVVEVIKGLLNVDYPLNLLEVIIVSDDEEAYVKELNNALGLTLKGINLDYRVIRRDSPLVIRVVPLTTPRP
ncbi:glycosyltransferase family 2 protein [Vulcanisaeta sp. JCM 16159]|uniref:glycosyltransferase n=1 Tax=Vulcanisaeta sp. JCM 16159 TaxID=1295371 RepID=UPI0006D180D2